MKTSSTKRALAFWLAVAMLAGSAPAALAAEMQTLQPAQQVAGDEAVTIPETEAADAPEGQTQQEEVAAPAEIQLVKIKVGESEETNEATIKVDGFKGATAQVKAYSDTAGNTLVTDVTWSIKETTHDGVTIDSAKGTITVDAKAKNGEYTITAKPKTSEGTEAETSAANTAKLTIQREASKPVVDKVFVKGVDVTGQQITIPAGETRDLRVTSVDQYGEDSGTAQYSVEPNDNSIVKITDNKLEVASGAKAGDTATVTVECANNSADTGKTFTVKVAPQQAGDIEIGFVTEPEDQVYTGENYKNPAVQKKNKADLTGTLSYKYEKVTPEKTVLNDVGMDSVKDVGHYRVTATYTEGGKTAYTSAEFEITPKQYNGVKEVPKSVLKNKTHRFDLPDDIQKLKEDTQITVQKPFGSVVKEATISGKVLTVTTKETIGEPKTENLVLHVEPKNYTPFNIIYKLTAVERKDISEDIIFRDKTEIYDGGSKTLDAASLATAEKNGTWTYTWTQADAKAAEQKPDENSGKMPMFTDIGVYKVTATYQDDNNWGQKTATLTIKPAVKSTLSISAHQLDSKTDDNYNNFNIKERDESDGYIRLYIDATDDLDRQDINDIYSEWIGMEITPKNNGSAANVKELYVSQNGTEWGRLRNGTYGDFFIEGVGSGDTFYLWYDTDDRDQADSLYLATDANGSNKFEIRVDFDAYSHSSSGGSSSGSSSTNKVDGQKVSTTTIDRSPSVSGSSASVSISSSTLSDALEKNKQEAKHEKADKTFIELDVKTSRSVDDTTVTVPVRSLDKIAREDTGLSVVTNQGTLQLDHRALSRIANVAGKNEVSIALEEDHKDQYTLMIKDGSSKIIDLGSGDAEITFSYKLKSGEHASDVKVYRVGDGSHTWLSTYGGSTVYGGTGTYAAATGDYVTNMGGTYSSSKKKITFSTDALGTFLVTTNNLHTGSGGNAGGSQTNPSYSTFVDVPSYRWSAPYINKLASLGVINGTGGGYFEPTLYVTREEFVKMLAGVARANVSSYNTSSFPDVSPYRWSAPYIGWAVSHGITTGTDGGRFAPEMKITREEMATMIYRYIQSAGKTLPNKNVPISFADAYQIDSWAVTPVSVMQQAGIIDGNVNNGRYTFDPKVPATREECAKMLSILYDLI